MTTTVRCPVCKSQVEVRSVLHVRFAHIPRHYVNGRRCPGRTPR